MAILRSFHATGLTPGSAITESTAGVGDSVFNSVNGTGATVHEGGLHGPRLQFDKVVDSQALLRWLGLGAVPVLGGRAVIELTGAPSATDPIIVANAPGGAGTWRIGIGSNGTLRYMTGSSSSVISTTVLGVGVEYRIEWSVSATAGTADVYLFEGDEETPLEVLNYTGPVATCDVFDIGPMYVNMAFPTLYVDSIVINDDGSLPGPVAETEGPTVLAAWPGIPAYNEVRAGFVTSGADSVRLAVSAAPDMSNPTFGAAVTPAANGWVSVQASSGISPNSTYYVSAELDGTVDTEFVTRVDTPPQFSSARNFKFLFGSCQITGTNHVVFDQMASENADFLVHMGDIHYGDHTSGAGWEGDFLTSLRQGRFQNLLATSPMSYTWDNHDWGGNNSWRDTFAPGDSPADRIRALSPYDDYAGARTLNRTWAWGRIRFIHLDMRADRDDPLAANSPTKTMLGAAQKQWFKDTLEASTEAVIIVAASYEWRLAGQDRWVSYPDEWQEIMDWLDARPTIRDRMYVLSGDLHMVAGDDGTNSGGGIPNVVGAAFHQTGSPTGASWTTGTFHNETGRGQYGLVTVSDTGSSITLQYEGKRDDGVTRVAMTTTFGESGQWEGSWIFEPSETGEWVPVSAYMLVNGEWQAA